jgi:trigger factor
MVKSKHKACEECASLFEIEVSKEDIARSFEEVYAEISKVANIPGFRPGKAPVEMVKKQYAANAREEALKRLVSDAYKAALEEHGINPVGFPEITDVSFEIGQPLLFKAKVETRPKFKVKNYKGIKVEKKKAVIKDDDVNKTIENLRELNAKYEAVEGRPVQMDDYVVADLDCSIDGKPLHKRRENIWLFIDKESMMPGLHEKMVGMNKGEERDVEVTLPEQYPDKNAAGKKVIYHVKAKELKKRVLPAVDDELAKDLGKDSLEQLKKDIAEELERRLKANIEIEAENQLLKKLVDENKFDAPKSLKERQLKYMVEDAKARLEQKGLKRAELDKKEEEFRAKFKEDAERQVRLFFILDEIAALEHVDISDADFDTAYKTISAQTGKFEKDIKEHYEKEDLLGDLEEKIRESKTIELLMKEANVVEVEG